MKTSLKKTWYVLMPLIAYVVVHDLVRLILMYLINLAVNSSASIYSFISGYDSVVSGIAAVLEMLAGTAVLLFIMKKDDIEISIWDYVNLNGISFYRADRIHPEWFSVIILVVQAISAAIGLNALLYLTGIAGASSGYGDTSSHSYSLPIWFGILIYGFISPAVEELLHRIIIFGRMKRCFPYFISVIVSSFFFGLYHQNVVQMIYGTAMGILMCLALEYVHSVAGSFLVHSLANLTVYILSAAGVFGMLGTVRVCIISLLIAAVSIALEIGYSYKSKKKLGIPLGIERVGIFFVDESLYDEYDEMSDNCEE